MTKSLSRRNALKLVAAGVAATGVACTSSSNKRIHIESETNHTPMQDNWSNTHDRTWLGGDYWANPMEDWHVVNGGAECLNRGGNRSIHSLTHQLSTISDFNISVRVKRIELADNDGGAGIRLGIRSDINEYKSNCFVQRGLDIGIKNNTLILGHKKTDLLEKVGSKELELKLAATPQRGAIALKLEAYLVESGKMVGSIEHVVAANDVLGNVALVSNFSLRSVAFGDVPADKLAGRYRFSNWNMSGDAFYVSPEQKFGPILWSMYTLSDSRSSEGFVMKMSVFTGPLGKKDNQKIELQAKRDGKWQSLGHESLDTDGWVAIFRIPNWNEKETIEYRAIYRERGIDNSENTDIYSGSIRANPVGRPLRMAALTCQNDYAFPYEPVATNVEKLNPDLTYFSGDQIYESHGGFGIVRAPAERAILNYLRKYYQFGWAFREVMRHQPTICLPDDHDVLQGNLWGAGGTPMKNPEQDPNASLFGGYIEPVRMVNAVHKTTVGHHPDPYDPTPNPSGINVYFGDLVYGDVSFAIIADRQWKTGPESINVEVGITGQDEDPLSLNPSFDPPGLELLGKRQEKYLAKWAQDWRGHKLKAVLSQTIFAGVATHQPTPKSFVKYDFDGSGWPATARNKAVELMRPAMPLHICGDTHLGTVCQYGVDEQRDSNWVFCTPAISVGWQRWWQPDLMGMSHTNRPSHGLSDTGEFLDSFGNKVYVWAVANPEEEKSSNRYVRAHEKASGFGFVTFDTEALTYKLDAYRFLVDVTDGHKLNQFPGWPLTIHQSENKGENKLS